MRFAAARVLGWDEIPCYVLPKSTTKDALRRIIIKDNASYGEWIKAEIGKWDVPENWIGAKIITTDGTRKITVGGEIQVEKFDVDIVLRLNFYKKEYDFVQTKLREIDQDNKVALLKVLGYGVETN